MDQPQSAAPARAHEPTRATTSGSTSISIHASPNLSADEIPDATNPAENTEDMARDHHQPGRGGRGPPPRRPELDLSAVLSTEQKNHLIQLINTILDGMHKQAREFWDNLGDDAARTRERIKPIPELQVSCCSIPNPRSVKYAHLYGNTPLLPEAAESSLPKDAADTAAKTTAKEKGAKPAEPSAPVPVLPPGMMLKVPKSMEEAIRMSGHNNDDEVVKFQMFEIRRDMLAHFGKWRGTVAKRLADIVIRNGGTAGNIVAGQGSSHVAPSGHGRRGGGGGMRGVAAAPNSKCSAPSHPSWPYSPRYWIAILDDFTRVC